MGGKRTLSTTWTSPPPVRVAMSLFSTLAPFIVMICQPIVNSKLVCCCLSKAHLDIFPVSVLRLVYVGPQLGPGSAGPHQVVSQVGRLDEAEHQVVLHDPGELAGVLLQLVYSLKLIIITTARLQQLIDIYGALEPLWSSG